MNWFPHVVKALDAVALLNIIVMLGMYTYALCHTTDEDEYAKRLIRGIITGWSSTGMLYANFSYVYWTGKFDVMTSVAEPWLRLCILFLCLLGTSEHIATGLTPLKDPWWPVVFKWLTGLILLAAALAVYDTYYPSLSMKADALNGGGP